MTQDEIDIMWQQAMRQSIEEGEMFTRYHFAKLVAAKERLAQPEQEPVAHDPLPRACNLAGVDYQTFLKIKAYMPVHATTPPQRTWVGLTGEDVVKAYDDYQSGRVSAGFMGAIRAIEAKLKEKNNV